MNLMICLPLYMFVWGSQVLFAQAHSIVKKVTNIKEKAIDESTFSAESFMNLPPSSFIHSDACDDEDCDKKNTFPFVFYLRKRINRPHTCNTIKFDNIPTDITTPLRGGNIFQKMSSVYNQRQAWSNGIEYLSYVNVGSYGTWIIGFTPGEDNGFVYIRPEFMTLVPTGLESTIIRSNGVSWRWNLDGHWKSMKQVTAICQDNINHSSSSSSSVSLRQPYYFEVDSFYSSNLKSRPDEPITHFLIPVVRQDNNNKNSHNNNNLYNKMIALFHDGTKKLLNLYNYTVLCSLGHPVYLSQNILSPTSSSGPTSVTRGTVVRLVNHEIGSRQTWRLTFRRINADIHITTATNTNIDNHSSPSSYHYENDEWNDGGKADITVSLLTNNALISQMFDENWSIRKLNSSEYEEHSMKMVRDIESTQVGDYLWIWGLPISNKDTSRINTAITSYMITNTKQVTTNDNNNDDIIVEATEMVLLCLSSSSSSSIPSSSSSHEMKRNNTKNTTVLTHNWVFRLYPKDRREQMSQTALARDINLVTISISYHTTAMSSINSYSNNSGNSNLENCIKNGNDYDEMNNIESNRSALLSMRISSSSSSSSSSFSKTTNNTKNNQKNHYHHNHYAIQGIVLIGSNPLPFIRRYIYENEHSLGADISSCYLYHAGVSLPAPLVYAAEVVCVLIGAKPVTMIQYTSEGDPSHKFPVIPELTTSIVHTILNHRNNNNDDDDDDDEDEVDIEYIVQRYRNYETIIFYRPSQFYIVKNLLPRDTAQALHPMPFPHTDKGPIRLQNDYQEQIYNAAWNGLILGYPERFVESYCIAFHNDLTAHEKVYQYQKAKRELEWLLKEQYNKSITIIQLGWEQSVTEQTWKKIEQVFDYDKKCREKERGGRNILY